jgi:transposase InsO family protein
LLDVFKSSYYYHQHSRTLTIGEKEKREEELKQKIIKIIEDNPAYGYRRIKPELKKQGIIINHKKLLFFLRKWGLNIKRKIIKKTKSGIDKILSFLGSRASAIKRLTDEELKTLGKVVFTDFTQIIYNEGKNKLWLIPYLENKTKKIVGYAVSKTPTTEVALKAFNMAVETLKSWGVDLTRTYFHQDQASIFKSYQYLDVVLRKTKALISFSRVGKPQDNPEIESFFGRLKDEWKKTFYQAKTESEILKLISQAILYYNSKRIHSNHKDKSPDEFLKSILKVKN